MYSWNQMHSEQKNVNSIRSEVTDILNPVSDVCQMSLLALGESKHSQSFIYLFTLLSISTISLYSSIHLFRHGNLKNRNKKVPNLPTQTTIKLFKQNKKLSEKFNWKKGRKDTILIQGLSDAGPESKIQQKLFSNAEEGT